MVSSVSRSHSNRAALGHGGTELHVMAVQQSNLQLVGHRFNPRSACLCHCVQNTSPILPAGFGQVARWHNMAALLLSGCPTAAVATIQ